MEKIAVKTKIKLWAVVGKQQKIVFKSFDMTSRQVGNLDKLIRNNKDEHVKLSINPDDNHLDIPAIESAVKLLGMECTGKGQHLKVSGFRCVEDKLDVLKQYIENESEIIITFEQSQEKMFDETPEEPCDETRESYDDPDSLDDYDDKPVAKEYIVNENGVITNPEVIKFKLPKKYNASVEIKIGKSNNIWYYGYDITIGNEGVGVPCDIHGTSQLDLAVGYAIDMIIRYIECREGFKFFKQTKKIIEKTVEDWKFENV